MQANDPVGRLSRRERKHNEYGTWHDCVFLSIFRPLTMRKESDDPVLFAQRRMDVVVNKCVPDEKQSLTNAARNKMGKCIIRRALKETQ